MYSIVGWHFEALGGSNGFRALGSSGTHLAPDLLSRRGPTLALSALRLCWMVALLCSFSPVQILLSGPLFHPAAAIRDWGADT